MAVTQGPERFFGAALVHRLVAQRPFDPAGLMDHQPRARSRRGPFVRLDHQDRGDGLLPLDGVADRLGRPTRPFRRLHEHVDHAVAAEAPAPHGFVVGGQVEVQELWSTRLHDLLRRNANVALQTAPADRAYWMSMLLDQEAGAFPPVGRTPHSHDRGQGHRLAAGPSFLDGTEHVLQLAHRELRLSRHR